MLKDQIYTLLYSYKKFAFTRLNLTLNVWGIFKNVLLFSQKKCSFQKWITTGGRLEVPLDP